MKAAPLISLFILSAAHAATMPLFDGKTLDGWEGSQSVWRVENGVIVGGSLEGNPRNEFLSTKVSYRNFILRLEYKLEGTEGFVNGGVQFRSKRVAQPPNEMSGFQADIGAGFSGCLYDESRRKRMLEQPAKALIEQAEKPGDWNRYIIRAEGARIRLVVNGTRTVDYTEREAGIAPDGLIALQIHGGNKARISFRNITLEKLPDNLAPVDHEVMNRFGDPAPDTKRPSAFPNGKFSLRENEVVVFTGQENFVRDQKAGETEAVLSAAFAASQPRFRSMAWEGDTVYEQWRDLNFGDWRAQLEAVNAGVIIAQFGQVEAFDGTKRLAEFKSAYHRLLDQFSTRTPRLVLVSPMPFEKPTASHAPDLRARNSDVKAYAEAVREVAKQRGALFVDLFTPWSTPPSERLTDDGQHLNAHGLRVVARELARQIGASWSEADDLSALRQAAVAKNRLWFDCWRPANWSFVYGDRITQMFGKPAQGSLSLQASFEARKPMIAAMDARIHALAKGEPVKDEVKSPPRAVTEAMLTPEQQMAAFSVADGYELNLFASETEGVAKPTQFSWDARGRLYVACSPTYPQTMPGVQPSDYILVLEDTDGDGKADKSTRFAEGLTMVQGVEPGAGGVYVCDFDQIVHLNDTNGDGKADEKTVLFAGFGIGDTHQLANSICHGPDGALWFSQGLHAFSRVETAHGLARLDKAGLWRLNPRTQQLESYFNGGKAGHNCWGVAFDDHFQVFHKSGDRPVGYYSVPGLVALPDPDEYHPIGALFDTNPKTNSLEFIGTRALPDDIQGCALIGGYFGNVVELHRLEDDGSGFKSTQLPKLMRSSDASFRPVDVSIGPDGAMYLCDWFNPVIGHYQASYADPRRDRTHGRIWRITAKGRPLVKQPALIEMSPTELLEQLQSPERWTRQQAKRLLFDMPTERVLKAATAFISIHDDERVLMEVCGVFEAHEAPNAGLVQRLLAAKDARVRAYGARVAAKLPNALALLGQAVRDQHPRVRLEAVVACGQVMKPEAVEVATQALDQPIDKFIDYALKQVVKHLKPQFTPVLNKLAFGGNEKHARFVKQIASAATVVEHPGKIVYDTLCLNCHQPEGKGLPGVYPSITRSDWVSGDPQRLIKILLHGLNGVIHVNGEEFKQVAPLPMPPMGLDDQQIADVLSYVRANFGNQVGDIKPAQVKAIRASTQGRMGFWTADELAK